MNRAGRITTSSASHLSLQTKHSSNNKECTSLGYVASHKINHVINSHVACLWARADYIRKRPLTQYKPVVTGACSVASTLHRATADTCRVVMISDNNLVADRISGLSIHQITGLDEPTTNHTPQVIYGFRYAGTVCSNSVILNRAVQPKRCDRPMTGSETTVTLETCAPSHIHLTNSVPNPNRRGTKYTTEYYPPIFPPFFSLEFAM